MAEESGQRAILEELEKDGSRGLPIGSVVDDTLMERVWALGQRLPESMQELYKTLHQIEPYVEFDAAKQLAMKLIKMRLSSLSRADDEQRLALLDFARDYMTPLESVPICRRLIKDSSTRIRERSRSLLRSKQPQEVSLPPEGEDSWEPAGWMRGTEEKEGRGRLFGHDEGVELQRSNGLLELGTVGALREFLGLKSVEQLGYFLLSSELEDGRGPYVRFEIPKRDGGMREICAPRQHLKWIQRKLLDGILSRVPVHDAAHGFVQGRSTVTNAAVHEGRSIVVKFDLEDFFPSIHVYRVMGLFAQLGYSVEEGVFRKEDESLAVAPVLARLTTYSSDPGAWGKGFLPQGAPTSPAIANLICRGMDARLSGLAESLGGYFTRYADDLTFSFEEMPQTKIGRFRWWVDQICQQEGFVLNQKKFRLIRRSQRQMVTGIVVNDTLRIPRKERRRFRAILHNCRQHGLESQARGHRDFPSYLRGYASYIHMVHPEEGSRFSEEVEELLKMAEEGLLPVLSKE